MSSVVASGDPASMLNAQLASALSTMGDAQFWEENISPSTIRSSLASSDPSSPHSTPALLKGMKWLLASISKGRDVSDFYPHVVKLVGAPSLEVRKMVYMFLVQYADHDATTRELSLLSINSFQRALGDSEQLIRALSLRVLTSIRIPDILQIQILGVQKCAKDSSPYVRKCAANALAKLSPRCTEDQEEMLLEIMKSLLDHDSSTMVLTSAVVAFAELCPYRLELLHGSFRKICHLLTDMDEWGQVIVIDTLARYCRNFFREPKAWKEGTAERIDRERRVRRTLSGIANETKTSAPSGVEEGLDSLVTSQDQTKEKTKEGKRAVVPKKVKRRVVKKGFYSDEEDESTEEEVYEGPVGQSSTIAGVMRQRNIMGVPGSSVPASAISMEADEDGDLDEDHRLLLRSSMPLLKSRNAGVVLAVCSLQYYCGVSSVRVRSSIGRALVRIHRDRREIQYVVLTSIRTLVHECPSAFAPFLRDFFVMAMDPSFTRMIKLDILTALALEPAAIEAVLKEFRTYIRHSDKAFACAAVQAVGTVVELARIVHDRHGAKSGEKAKERRNANWIALNCLHGLVTLTKASENAAVIGECVIVMQRILLLLCSGETVCAVDDPNHVQDAALRRVLFLLSNTLNLRAKRSKGEEEAEEEDGNSDDEGGASANESDLFGKAIAVDLPPAAFASALWIIGEWMSSQNQSRPGKGSLRIPKVDQMLFSQIRQEVCRLVARTFADLEEPSEKEQAIHFATKMLVSSKDGISGSSNPKETAFCETILSMGRIDVNPDVRDRARHESNLIHLTIGLQYDQDGIEAAPNSNGGQKPTLDHLKRMLLQIKPASSSLPLEDVHYKNRAGMGESGGLFRFGTLSSLVGHRARTAYLPLPAWSEDNSPSSLRDPLKRENAAAADGVADVNKGRGSGFYDEDDAAVGSSSSDSDSSDSSSSSDDSSSSSSDDSYAGDINTGDGAESSSSDENSSDNALFPTMPTQPYKSQQAQTPIMNQPQPYGDLLNQNFAPAQHQTQAKVSTVSSDGSSSSDSESESGSSSSDEDDAPSSMGGVGSLIPMGGPPMQQMAPASANKANGSKPSSAADDLKGLVLEPVVVDANEGGAPDIEKDSSSWLELLRPEYAGGLSVKARYLRGKTKAREVQMLGMTAEKTSTLCLQVRFENQRTDGGVIRRLRMLQRSSSSTGSHIGPKKVAVPNEIASLKQGQMSNVMLGIDFASASDRDDSLLARFDIKFNGGSAPVELRPGLGQLLQPCERNVSDFKSGMSKLQGFNRVANTFQVDDASFLTSRWIGKHANLTPLKGSANSENLEQGLHLVGSLPASGDPVYVTVTCSQAGSGTVTVCCEQALAVNGIANSLKKAITEKSPGD